MTGSGGIPRFSINQIVKVVHADCPVGGREGVVRKVDLRIDKYMYHLHIDGEEVGWVFPETSLESTGKVVSQPENDEIGGFPEGTLIRMNPSSSRKRHFVGLLGRVIGRVRDGGGLWYTVEDEAGEIVVLRDREVQAP